MPDIKIDTAQIKFEEKVFLLYIFLNLVRLEQIFSCCFDQMLLTQPNKIQKDKIQKCICKTQCFVDI